MKVPFVDLRAQHEELRTEIDQAIRIAIDNSAFIGGPAVERFEQNFAHFIGSGFAVACSSGTDALRLALMAAGVRAGDEVVTVPNTFIATVEAITILGARPAFVDVDPQTRNLSIDALNHFLMKQCRLGKDGRVLNIKTGRTVTALLPVHLYGLPADMGPTLKLAHQFSLAVVEDACQAHGAGYELNGAEKKAGTLGKAAAFSFYPGKNLGAMGEGGAVTTSDESANRQMRIWRDHGQSERYIHISPDGWNGRLDAIQSVILDLKLKKLDEWNERRRKAAVWYRERLAGDDRIVLPTEPANARHVYHLFVVQLPDREKARRRLSEGGIGVGLHYPIPLHLQNAYQDLGYRQGDFPVAENLSATTLSLPMFPHLSEEQVDYVCTALKEAI
jgi:dTDP-4-amino-4,6-dideoxygalactose transaminase